MKTYICFRDSTCIKVEWKDSRRAGTLSPWSLCGRIQSRASVFDVPPDSDLYPLAYALLADAGVKLHVVEVAAHDLAEHHIMRVAWPWTVTERDLRYWASGWCCAVATVTSTDQMTPPSTDIEGGGW